MTDNTAACRQLYIQAEHHLGQGDRELGIATFVEAEKMLVDVPDCIQYLALYLRAEKITRKYLLPETK